MYKIKFKFIHDRRGTGADNSPIELYVYFGFGGKIYLKTNLSVNKNQWNQKKWVVNHPQKEYYNSLLRVQLHNIQQEELNFLMAGRNFTLKDLRNFIEGNSGSNFLQWCKNYLDADNRLAKDSKRPAYRLLQFLEDSFNEVKLSDLNYTFLQKFDNLLRAKDYTQNTVKRFHKDLKKFINLAVKHDMMKPENNPYLKFKLQGWQPKTEFLYQTEVDKIAALDLSENIEFSVIKDMFVFACYSGLRYGDFSKLTVDNFEQRNEGLILNLKGTEKTDTPVFLRLYEMFEGKPAEIAQRYLNMNTSHKYIWKRSISNQQMNLFLKDIGAMAGISKKKLTVHLARHTFGTLYARETKNLFEVCRAMGIKNFKTGQIYINLSGML